MRNNLFLIVKILIVFLIAVSCQKTKKINKIIINDNFKKIIYNDIREFRINDTSTLSKKRLLLITTKFMKHQDMFIFYETDDYVTDETDYLGYFKIYDYIILYVKSKDNIGINKNLMNLTSENRKFNSVKLETRKDNTSIENSCSSISYVFYNDSLFRFNSKWDIVFRGVISETTPETKGRKSENNQATPNPKPKTSLRYIEVVEKENIKNVKI